MFHGKNASRRHLKRARSAGATGARVQIALFVTPLLVFISYGLGHPLDLIFSPFERLAVGLGVAVFAYLIINGESNWYEGVQLLAVYAIIAVALFFLPIGQSAAPAPAPGGP